MSEYTFPFNTCEKVNKNGIAQPYSVLFNLINCFIILYFLLKTKHNYAFLLLFSILCFEVFHSFSHMIHIPGIFIIYLIVLVCLDLYSLFNLTFIYYISTQSIIFISLLIYYFALLPKFIQNSMYQLFILIIVIILLFLNESYNCERMLEIYPHFPYHIFIEIAGIIFFYLICSNFYKL